MGRAHRRLRPRDRGGLRVTALVPAEAALRAASNACAEIIRPEPIAPVIARLTATPWRIVVVGRIGTGKSTLVTRWTGVAVPVGLGGVTAEVTTARDRRGAEIIDTPGIDAEDAARAELGPLLDDTDAVVWVVDGLTPATATERAIVLGARPSVLHVVISRMDLVDPSERDAVLDRVRSACGDRAVSVRAGDLRALPIDDLGVIDAMASPRRREAARRAVADADAAVNALPPAPTRAGLLEIARTAWRREVREIEDVIAVEVERGLTDDRDRAVRRLTLLAPHARKEFLDQWPYLFPAIPTARPDLPLPDPPPKQSATAWVVSGGQEGALRALRAAAGRWLLDGDLALEDHFAEVDLPDPLAARIRAAAALRHAEAVLRG